MNNKLMRPFATSTLFPENLFDQFMDSFFNGLDTYDPETGTLSLLKGFPKGDVFIDKDGNGVIELSLAGYKKDQLSVSVDGKIITVQAKKCEECDDNRVYSRARRAFTQRFTNFGDGYDLENANVSYENGLLKIVVPKKEIKIKEPRQLEIK